eukprot:7075696-Prymnesium_polylepis.1
MPPPASISRAAARGRCCRAGRPTASSSPEISSSRPRVPRARAFSIWRARYAAPHPHPRPHTHGGSVGMPRPVVAPRSVGCDGCLAKMRWLACPHPLLWHAPTP